MTIRTFLSLALALLFTTPGSIGAGTFTFSNTNAILINDSINPPTVASPYPSTNRIIGLDGALITKVTVQLFGFSHTFPSDVDIVLVGPEGQNAVLMANTGGSSRMPVTNLNLTFDDDAGTYLPLETNLVSGTFRPTTNAFSFFFPEPAPATNEVMGPFLANFKNIAPNGTWSLFIVDDASPDSGIIAGGWSLTITTTPLLLSIKQQQTNVILSWTNAAIGYTLQSTPTLSPLGWTNVGTTPTVVDGYYTIQAPLITNKMFYRLVK